MSAVSSAVRRGFRRLGLDVRRKRRFPDEFAVLTHLLHVRSVETVIDVGANIGQFAENMRRAGYAGRIISFEPMPIEHRKLAAHAATDPHWTVAPPVALSDSEGETELHVAGNSISSSLLPMGSLHTDTAPKSVVIRKISVRTARLDAIIPELVPTGPLFLKLDVQGYEDVVLAGATGIMHRLGGIKTEMSFAELYEGQVLFDALHARITSLGFELWDLTPGLRNDYSARLLQCDAVYLKKN